MQPSEEKSPSLATYIGVYVALMVLLALTAGAAFINLGAFNLPVALGIALLKAALVALFFMHLKSSGRLNWIFVIGGLFWLLILFALTWADYVHRI